MFDSNDSRLPPKGAQIPLLGISSIDEALVFANQWQSAGNTHVEVLLRSENALEAIRTLVAKTDLRVAAGTILEPHQLDEAVAAGAHLAVSPGTTAGVLSRALELGIPLIPGVHSPSEVQFARSQGLRLLKFFPASLGGTQFLAEIAPVFPDVEFIPSGGVREDNFREFLSLSNVRAVGGRWMLKN